ncbi:polyprenyl synthetase family protein [Pelagibacterium halotolerans]|uniref:polyprenyl synthetase family protein n=1 Tax=Pelagibacterium halotolerans TaxID=531813 RepID=UPI00384D95CA
MDLTDALAACAVDTESFLAARLDVEGAPTRLVRAIAHGALNGGKRLRPFLVRASAEAFGVAHADSLAAGAALEMVHCYSLIHDDLPDMDNDAMRRGRQTVWKAFDPALAILAGDALLTEAFAVLADPVAHADAAIRVELIGVLASRAGMLGMVGGQVADIEGETIPLDEAGIIAMQRRKTGALIGAGVEMGAILGRADTTQRAALIRYGEAAGLAFQLADDILDVTATSADLGKTAGKDVAQNKSTIVARRGLNGARDMLIDAVEDGVAALSGFGAEADMLRALIVYFAEREN